MLKNGLLDLNSLRSCPHLHRLQELHLQVVFGSDTIGPELAALLQHTPRLAAGRQWQCHPALGHSASQPFWLLRPDAPRHRGCAAVGFSRRRIPHR